MFGWSLVLALCNVLEEVSASVTGPLQCGQEVSVLHNLLITSNLLSGPEEKQTDKDLIFELILNIFSFYCFSFCWLISG